MSLFITLENYQFGKEKRLQIDFQNSYFKAGVTKKVINHISATMSIKNKEYNIKIYFI